MKKILGTLRKLSGVSVTGEQLVKFNLIATVLWIMLVVPTLVYWRDSVLWVALMSIWANVVGHFSAYVAARAEVQANGSGDQSNSDDFTRDLESLRQEISHLTSTIQRLESALVAYSTGENHERSEELQIRDRGNPSRD